MTLYEFILTLFPEDLQTNPAYEQFFLIGTLVCAIVFLALIARAFLGLLNIAFK